MKKIVLKSFVDNRLPRPMGKKWEKGLVFDVANDPKTRQFIAELEKEGLVGNASSEEERNATPENQFKGTKQEPKKRTRKKSE